MGDRMIKVVTPNGGIRGVALVATELVRDLGRMHSLTKEGKKGLGEVVMGGLLLASGVKSGERINLKVDGTGRFFHVLSDAYPDGQVRGMLSEREPEKVDLAPEPGHEVAELGPWGRGFLQVLKTKVQPGSQPFIGTVPLVTGHFAKDLTFYWVQSEQIPTAVGLTVNVDDLGEVQSAGAFLIQVMPGANDEEISKVDLQVQNFPDFEENFARDPDPMRILAQIFQDEGFHKLDEMAISRFCPCDQERVKQSLALFGEGELKDMLAKEGKAVLNCDFCRKDFTVDGAEIKEILLQSAAKRK